MRDVFLIVALLASLGASRIGVAAAADMQVPSAKAVIYPGELITDNALVDIPFAGPNAGGPIALSRDELIGKVARRTLLPGQTIALAAIDNPRVIRNGSEVTMVYIDGALVITTVGDALQDGGLGDLIKVRNSDSGVTVQGRVRGDGSVLVGGG